MFFSIICRLTMRYTIPIRRASLLVHTSFMLLAFFIYSPHMASAGTAEMALNFFKLVQSDGMRDLQTAGTELHKTPPLDPNWPTLMYLFGEAQLKNKNMTGACRSFRELASWAVNSQQSGGPYKDGWGGSGLAAIALWRWLQILDARWGTAEEIDQALKIAFKLQRTRLFSGMVRGGLCPALPLIEEDIARLLAHIAWRDNRPNEAITLFLDFVSIDSTGEFDEIDNLIVEKMFRDGVATPERLNLFRSRRQIYSIKTKQRKQFAVDQLKMLWEDKDAPFDVRAEAGYEWSAYCRKSVSKKKKVVAVLNSVFDLARGRGLVSQKALYLRAMVQNSVKPKDPNAFFADMNQLLDRFPRSRLADEALYQLATENMFASPPNMDQALSYFQKLREFGYANDKLDSAFFLAAIGLIDRGTVTDLNEADQLLANYVDHYPDGVFRQHCIFWRGRIAERNKETEKARRFYQQVVDEAPYDYYGLRASMHLESGADAISMVLPRADSQTLFNLHEAYRNSVPDVELMGTTQYHERLRAVERNGLYAQLLAIFDSIGKQFHNRLDNIPLRELGKHNLIPAVSLLLAFRQDAMAARDSVLSADNHLRLSGFFSKKMGDWPTAISMVLIRGDAPHQRITKLQNDKRFLATVYPGIDDLHALKQPLTDAAWEIDGSVALSKSLMYAVIRNESCFYPGAISLVGALGLFQIMPSTFEGMKECWELRGPDEKPTATSYLFNPARSIQFWSCWLKKEFKPYTRDSIALMLVKHHAGTGNLNEWMNDWKGRTFEHDLEMQIDTYRFPATQHFVRHVLTDVTIASSMFEGHMIASPEEKP
jgi:TolA-binding protein